MAGMLDDQMLAALLGAQGFGGGVMSDQMLMPQRNPAMPADWAQRGVLNVGQKLANILMAPGRAMDQGMTTEQAIPWAGDTAMMMGGIGAPNAPSGALGAFGGRPPRIFNNTSEWMPGLPKISGENMPQVAPMTPGGWFYPQPKYNQTHGQLTPANHPTDNALAAIQEVLKSAPSESKSSGGILGSLLDWFKNR